MNVAYFEKEIKEMAQRPGINEASVLAELSAAGRNEQKLEAIHAKLLEDLYGDDIY